MFGKIALVTVALLANLYLSWPVIAGAQVVSPATNEPYRAALVPGGDYAYVGEPYFIHFRLFPATLPPGYSVSTLVDPLEYPAGARPEIVPGFPATQLKMTQAGAYTYAIRISLITKSSCAGVDAEEIFERTFTIEATER